MSLTGARIHIGGIVQGVGFRPFVYGLAARLALTGWVCNTSAGVEIALDGPAPLLEAFATALRREAPPLAHIDTLDVRACPPAGFTGFEILHSQAVAGAFQPISADICTCPDCLRELFDPADRRHRYPFINCTHCGPRFTIIHDLPYDRPQTSMAGFPLCPQCAAEYANPLDRRFHAQPVACPQCGPHVWLETAGQSFAVRDDAILHARRWLADGKILAIKGLGGFHLACDAANPAAVAELRRRKLRVDKPFALMMPDLATVRLHCHADVLEGELLQSHARPIVILERIPGAALPAEIAPGQDCLGVMLPYTPLHFLLFAPHPGQPGFTAPQVLVMTSANLSEEPIAIDNQEARDRLSGLADGFLMHNRPIRTRCDDSVVLVGQAVSLTSPTPPHAVGQAVSLTGPTPPHAAGQADSLPYAVPLRRSRGYAPFPLHLAQDAPPLLATGAGLKNTFCLLRQRYAFLSQHIGDLENYETLCAFEDSVAHFEKLFRIQPQVIACDLHPDYLATRYAVERAARQGLPLHAVQHHHAHIAACMAEHGLPPGRDVIGVAFDGTGYGEDGAIWGGEFLVANYATYQRRAHLAYVPLPGGDAAIKRPARSALAHLWQAGLDWEPGLAPVDHFCADERAVLRGQLEQRINTPLTSSVGRLFDAAAALAGIRQRVNYEAQAAIEFEACVDPLEAGDYPFEILPIEPGGADAPGYPQFSLSPAPLFAAMLDDLHHGRPVAVLAARFHNSLASMALAAISQISAATGIRQVALSGGVWQNRTLLQKTVQLLAGQGYEVLCHHLTPPNDGGLSLGQALVALNRLTQ